MIGKTAVETSLITDVEQRPSVMRAVIGVAPENLCGSQIGNAFLLHENDNAGSLANSRHSGFNCGNLQNISAFKVLTG
ncbi:MAG: hypothetical protein IPN11_15465 [Opitutaceae bacterium]|nr:hypothetical protein [Opitutaceae bacterium]